MAYKKKILMLNGSFCEKPIIEKAREMGYYVVSTGNDPSLIGHQSANEYICCDYSDKEAVLELVKNNGIEGIISCANDFGVLTAAYVAEKMGFPGHDSYETALLLHHKDRFKRYCLENHIPSPVSRAFDNPKDANAYIESCKYPIIIKANDLTGGKGIKKAENQKEALEAIENAFTMSREKRIVIEPFIRGKQYSYNAFLVDQNVKFQMSNSCYSFVNPFLIQAEIFPADDLVPYYKRLSEIVTYMAKDLHLVNGIICLQMIISEDEIYIFETMRRCFGNDVLSVAEKANGFPWIHAYIESSLGLPYSESFIEKNGEHFGHFGVMAKQNGTVLNWAIPPEVIPHIYRRIEMNGKGKRITDYNGQRIEYLFYSYETQKEAQKAVESLYRNTSIEIGA